MSSTSGAYPARAPSAERSALVVGDELARVDRVVSLLRKTSLTVRRVLGAPAAVKLTQEASFDIIIATLPLNNAREFLATVRAEDSQSRRASLLVVLDESADPARVKALEAQGNRVLPPAATPEEILAEAELLLRVAPRVFVKGSARIHVGATGSHPLTLTIGNVSATGMLVYAKEPLPLNSGFAFELVIPSMGGSVRGQARVARHTPGRTQAEKGLGCHFRTLVGDGAKVLDRLTFQELAAASTRDWVSHPGSAASSSGEFMRIRDADELTRRKAELEDLDRQVEPLLEQGLTQRVRAADWYVTAAELGLESLAAFGAILEAVHGGVGKNTTASQQIADLAEVRKNLAEFSEAKQTDAVRLKVLLQMRRSLERLLRALAITGAFSDEMTTGSRPKGLVAELALDIQRLQRTRQFLSQLQPELRALGGFGYLFARRARARKAEEICRTYSTWAADLSLEDPKAIRKRRGRRRALLAVDREIRKLNERLTVVHRRVYSPPRFEKRASKNQAADFAETKLLPILVETLAAGAEFLVRAYSAYRHALELTGTDPRLLQRMAGLASSVAEAEIRLASQPAPRA